MKKVLMILVVFICSIACLGCDNNQTEGKVVFTLFYGDTCPHCQELEEFIDSLDDKTKAKFELKTYEVYKDFGNNALKSKTAKKYGITCDGVPCFFIGEQPFYGYSAGMNDKILKAIDDDYNSKHFNDQVDN